MKRMNVLVAIMYTICAAKLLWLIWQMWIFKENVWVSIGTGVLVFVLLSGIQVVRLSSEISITKELVWLILSIVLMLLELPILSMVAIAVAIKNMKKQRVDIEVIAITTALIPIALVILAIRF